MSEELKIQQYLESNPTYSIDIYDNATQNVIHRKLTYAGLIKLADNITELFRNIYHNGISVLIVQKYKPNGSSNKRYEIPYIITLKPQTTENLPKEVVKETAQSATEQPAVAQPVSNTTNLATMQQHVQQHLGMGAAFGMSMPQMVDLHTKSQRFDEIKETNLDLKTKVRKLETTIDELNADNRQLKAKLDVADERKEIALEREAMKSKPMVDPSFMNGLVDLAKEAMPMLAAKSSASTNGMAAADTTNDLPENKKGLISLVEEKEFPDEMALELVYIAIGLQKSEKFTQEVRKAIEENNIKNLV